MVAEGDVAFEVNPGGACWGADTDLKVTPDILPGDVVAIEVNDIAAGDDGAGRLRRRFDAHRQHPEGRRAHRHAGVSRDQLGQRIVGDLTATDVNRRDTRAVPDPLRRSPGRLPLTARRQRRRPSKADTFTTQAAAVIAASGGDA